MNRVAQRIASIIGNRALALAVHNAVSEGLAHSNVHLAGGRTVWRVFEHSLNAAIRDIEMHPRGRLFRRLLQYGPHNPDDPPSSLGDGDTILSDPECGEAVEFIFSHMVNRFKGELAELLAIELCVLCFDRLRGKKRVPSNVHLYWGETIQERCRSARRSGERKGQWGKGADGLLIGETPPKAGRAVRIWGIVEVKSMNPGWKGILEQIDRHAARLAGGVRLEETEYPGGLVSVDASDIIRVIVVPSRWRLSREWRSEKQSDDSRRIAFPECSGPPTPAQLEDGGDGLWKIRLAWSEEALEQAAYEMTFWYMSQVGRVVYDRISMPKSWARFTSQEAGYNAIKMMLYCALLRPLSDRHERLAVRLYNVYSFGYPLGVDSKEMLWPEDVAPGGGQRG